MKINLKTEPREPEHVLELQQATTIEELMKPYVAQLPYTILAARVDHEIKELTFQIEKDCSVELLDMRTQEANLIYQYSLCFI